MTESLLQQLERRFNENELEIRECLNFDELVPLLCEGTSALLSFQEGQSLLDSSLSRRNRTDILFQKMAEKGLESYSTFLSCVEREDSHLGHSYIQALLEGRHYASEIDIALSKMLRQAVVGDYTAFSNGISFPELSPHMFQCGLLTKDELKNFTSTQRSTKAVMDLFATLDTKGPLAYNLFANCLRDEDNHRTHHQLYSIICKDVTSQSPGPRKRANTSYVSVLCKRVPQRLRLRGPLRGKDYDKLMITFQTYHHNGEWMKLEAEADKYLKGENIPCEKQVVALLEMAVSCILRRKDEKIIVDLVEEAKRKCAGLGGDNLVILEGRCEYVLSRHSRYLKDHKEAKKHAENAKKILFNVEPGEDSAFANYCDGCAMVEMLSESSTLKEVEEVECYFKIAIYDARSHGSGLDLVAPHSFMRLAQMYLGSSHFAAGSVRDKENIDKAANCLNNIDPTTLQGRSRCNFLLIESDLYQSKGMLPEAEEAARCALELSKKLKFNNEDEAAKNRLQALKVT